MRERPSHRPSGFTLIELMIAVSILALLAAIALPMYIKQAYRAKSTEAAINLSGIRVLMLAFHAEHETFIGTSIEPPQPVTGLKKTWPDSAPLETWETTGLGTFANIGFRPTGEVYFHYGCVAEPGAVRCEAATDLDGSAPISIWQIALRSTEQPHPSLLGPFDTNPVAEWHVPRNLRLWIF